SHKRAHSIGATGLLSREDDGSQNRIADAIKRPQQELDGCRGVKDDRGHRLDRLRPPRELSNATRGTIQIAEGPKEASQVSASAARSITSISGAKRVKSLTLAVTNRLTPDVSAVATTLASWICLPRQPYVSMRARSRAQTGSLSVRSRIRPRTAEWQRQGTHAAPDWSSPGSILGLASR